MKELFESSIIALNFEVIKGWEITFIGHNILNEIAEKSNNFLCLYCVNFDFLMFFEQI